MFRHGVLSVMRHIGDGDVALAAIIQGNVIEAGGSADDEPECRELRENRFAQNGFVEGRDDVGVCVALYRV